MEAMTSEEQVLRVYPKAVLRIYKRCYSGNGVYSSHHVRKSRYSQVVLSQGFARAEDAWADAWRRIQDARKTEETK